MTPKKLTSKRARKTTAGEGSSITPPVEIEFDGHRFCGEEHQCSFEVIKDWSFLKERIFQLPEGEHIEFQAEIASRHWTQLAEPMRKYDPEIVMEFYANAWPTEEGVMDKCSIVRGQWIPYDTYAINQFLRNLLILEEGQQCEYIARRSQTIGFDEKAIGQLLCFPGRDFVRIMLVYNIMEQISVHVAQLISDVIHQFVGTEPPRHPVDPEKSNKALRFPALITGIAARARSTTSASNRCTTTTFTSTTILGVHLNPLVEDGALDAHIHASFG
ncbi:hypothetical protein HKD37_02G004840 [Glycine soja]